MFDWHTNGIFNLIIYKNSILRKVSSAKTVLL